MKRMAMLAVAALPLAACQDRGPTGPEPAFELPAPGSGIVYQVSGGGAVVREDLEGAPREIYGFQAQVDAAGNVRGEAEVHFPSDEVKMHIDVQCLVVERNRAWLSGPVTRSDDPETPVGRVFVWLVQDNGEGHDAPPDRISNFIHRPGDNFPPDICERTWSLETFAWDDGNVRILTPGMPGLWDLVGTWDAKKWICINLANPADSQSLLGADSRIRQTIAPDGRYSAVWWAPASVGGIYENTAGWLDVDAGVVRMFTDGWSMILEFPLDIDGNVWRTELDANVCHWDGDDIEDPSHLIAEFRRKRTGVLIEDLAGDWEATAWRYTSVADPGTSVDMVADEGLSITLTVLLESRFYLTVEPLGWTSTTDWLLLDGDRMLTRSEEGDASSLTFSLRGDTWTFTGLDAHDFGSGIEPATVEAVLARR